MKEAVVGKGPKITIRDVDIPKPGRHQVVTKVIFSGSNPKDWKVPEWMQDAPPMNQGDDIAGTVHAVGEGVEEFKVGDRVAAFHEMLAPHGSYGEYAVSWDHTTFKLPDATSFEEGAALPLAALTAVVGMYSSIKLNLPQPWSPATKPTPLLIYGASSAVGYYVLQLALKSNLHPLICIAGRASAHVDKLLDKSKGDAIVDYRQSNEDVAKGIKAALNGQKLEYAFDAVSEKGSYQIISEVLDKSSGKITLGLSPEYGLYMYGLYTNEETLLPPETGWDTAFEEIPKGIQQSTTNVGAVHRDMKDLGYVYSRYFTRGLQEGWFKAQPQEVVPGGLGGIQSGLERLKDGTASAVKYVFKISDTEGAGSGS